MCHLVFSIIVQYEGTGVGVQFYNLYNDNFNLAGVFGMMFADFILYGVLAWYLDLVLPQEFGTPEHPLFIFSYSYWCKDWVKWFGSLCDNDTSDALSANKLAQIVVAGT